MNNLFEAIDNVKKFFQRNEPVKTVVSPLRQWENILTSSGFGNLAAFLKIEENLLARYLDYEEMDEMPELSSALDLFSDDSTQPSMTKGTSLWIESSDGIIKKDLEKMLDEKCNVEEEIWELARELCKYGNEFENIIVEDNKGVLGLQYLPTATMRVVADRVGSLKGYYQTFVSRKNISQEQLEKKIDGKMKIEKNERVYSKYEVAHFRLGGRARYDVYGRSILEASRWIWRRLMLMEDSMLIYRVTRAPSRYVFYIDVGDRNASEAMQFMNKIKNDYKKHKFVNPSTGRLDMRYNPLTQDEDIFIPIRHGREGTKIDVLQGPSYQAIDDIEYFRNKLFAAIKIPKSYLGFEADISAKNLLTQEDVRYCRTILRVQRAIRNGYMKVCKVHLAAKNIDPAKHKFKIAMTVPSAIYEAAQVEIMNIRAELAEKMVPYVGLDWIYKYIFQFTDKEIIEVQKSLKTSTMSDEFGMIPEPSAEEGRNGRRKGDRVASIGKKAIPHYDAEKIEKMFRKSLKTSEELMKRINMIKPLLQDLARHRLAGMS